MQSARGVGSSLWIVVLAGACGDDGAAVDGSTGSSSSAGSTAEATTAPADSSSGPTAGSSSEGSSGPAPDSSGESSGGGSSSGTPNTAPVAVDDLYVMIMDDAALVLAADAGVLLNDSDPDGDAITVDAFDAMSVHGGTVALEPDGALSYTPPLGYWGEDGFDYTIGDGNGGSDSAHVRVMITPTTVSLGTVDGGAGGFTITGIAMGDQAGWSVAGGGDVDGDGHADVLVGAVAADVDGNAEGRAFVVAGTPGTATVALGDVAMGTGGFAIDGAADTDQAGHAVAHAGDVNGDGLADVIVGAPQADAVADDEGRAYVVFGKADGDAVALASLAVDGTGFAIDGIAANDLAGFSVGGGGDVNGDGLDDVVVGAPQAEVGGIVNAGRAWVVFGKADTDTVLLADVDGGAGGFAIDGISTEDRTGEAVAGLCDANGDGLDDVLVGVPFANPGGNNNAGRAFVVFGKADTTPVDLAEVAVGSGGYMINGIAALDQAGDALSGAGDVDGDGRCDVIVGAPGAEDDMGLSGRSFVVFGKASGVAVALADVVTGTGGFLLEGQSAGDLSGWAVGGGGDLDGDGRGDVLVGAQNADYAGYLAGRSYAIYGRSDTAEVALADVAAGQGGFAIDGAAPGDVSGWALGHAGDVSGDGFADLVIGAYDAPDGDGFGRAYVVFGGDFDAGIALVGTDADDTLDGSALDETLVGGAGDDTLRAYGGADVLYGGPGDDAVVLIGAELFRIDGGTGLDTLVLDGDGLALDLPAFYEVAITGIEAVDLTGSGDNSLFLELRDLRAMSKTSNDLLVLGDAGDQVVADFTGSGMVDLGIVDGYAVYGDGVMTLRVAQAVEAFVAL